MDKKKAKKQQEAARARKSGRVKQLTAKQKRNQEAEEAAERVVMELLRTRVDAEEQHNDAVMRQLKSGDAELSVACKYGDVVQLLHRSSRKFASICERAAPYDAECRAVELAIGSSASQFRIMPKFKAQVIGNVSTLAWFSFDFSFHCSVQKIPLHSQTLRLMIETMLSVSHSFSPSFKKDRVLWGQLRAREPPVEGHAPVHERKRPVLAASLHQ
jgi:hypothetical protein